MSVDRWRLAEWNALPDVCDIAGCETYDADQRGPVIMRDGSMHKLCTEHWEPVFRVLGEQVIWERTDAYRESPEATTGALDAQQRAGGR